MQESITPTTPNPKIILPNARVALGMSGRAVVGLFLLAGATLLALALAWLWPDNTLLHFWLVAQGLPVFYALLAWWWARQAIGDVDEL